MFSSFHRYFSSRLESGIEDSSQRIRDNLIGLIDIFIFQRASAFIPSPSSEMSERPGEVNPLGAVDEVQLLITMQELLEGQVDVDLRCSVFDGIFGGITEVRGKLNYEH